MQVNLAPDHFDGDRFYNPSSPQARGFVEVLRWKLTSRPERYPFDASVNTSIPPKLVEGGELRVTMVNHSTVLLQQNGKNILTDPVWAERVSPVAWSGPRRYRAPGVRLDQLPEIHLVLVSHNHYDHLDLPSLREIQRRWHPVFVAPLKVDRFLQAEGFERVMGLDWGQQAVADGVTVDSVPALHFSARGLFDRNKTLWCGYVIDGEIYFAADTGFGAHFEAIRAHFGPPRLALLPIGAYLPRWFMSPVHMGPDEAVRAHQILGSGTSIAIHHGTFQLADDGIDTPKRELALCLKREGIDAARFRVLANGEDARID
ncbi:MAG TPA: MBL fold metallo-hydrolase [Bryobacteraceae bacterium]|nr:MBL fold metallo-hydrolase [Bryobacteraceae bacterium]